MNFNDVQALVIYSSLNETRLNRLTGCRVKLYNGVDVVYTSSLIEEASPMYALRGPKFDQINVNSIDDDGRQTKYDLVQGEYNSSAFVLDKIYTNPTATFMATIDPLLDVFKFGFQAKWPEKDQLGVGTIQRLPLNLEMTSATFVDNDLTKYHLSLIHI